MTRWPAGLRWRAGVADANRESKLVGTPVAWTCDLDRLLRSSCVICALQCMKSVHWSTQATAVTLVQRQMAMIKKTFAAPSLIY